MQAWLDFIKGLIEELAPTLAVLLWDYEQSKVDQANNDKEKAQLELQLEKNHAEVDASLAGKSDLDILVDAITPGASDRGQSETDDETIGPAASGNNPRSNAKS